MQLFRSRVQSKGITPHINQSESHINEFPSARKKKTKQEVNKDQNTKPFSQTVDSSSYYSILNLRIKIHHDIIAAVFCLFTPITLPKLMTGRRVFLGFNFIIGWVIAWAWSCRSRPTLVVVDLNHKFRSCHKMHL